MSKSSNALKILNDLKNGASTLAVEKEFKAATGDVIPAYAFYCYTNLKAWLERYIIKHA